jgi:hypothetical protein
MSAAMGLTASFQIRLAALARAKPGKITGNCAARLTISRELGHEREQVTAVYLGR